MMRAFLPIAAFAVALVSAEQAALTKEEPLPGGGYNDQLVKRALSVNPTTAAEALKKIRGDPTLMKKLERAKKKDDGAAKMQDFRDKFRTIRICQAGLQSWATDWKERITAIRLAPGFVVDGIKSFNDNKIYLPPSFYIVAEYFTLAAKVLSYWLGSIAASYTFMSYQWHSQYLAWWFTNEDWRMREDMGVLTGEYAKSTAEKGRKALEEHNPKDEWGFTKQVAEMMGIKDFKSTALYKGENKFWKSKYVSTLTPAGAGNGWGEQSLLEVDEKVEQPVMPAVLVDGANNQMPPMPSMPTPSQSIAEMAEVAQKARLELAAATPAVPAAAQVPVNVAPATQLAVPSINNTLEDANALAFQANFMRALSNTTNKEIHMPAKLPDVVQAAVIKLNSMPVMPQGVLEQFKKNKAAVQKADAIVASFRENLSVLGCAISDLMERQANGLDQIKCVDNELLEFMDVGFHVPDYILDKIQRNMQNFRYIWLWFMKIFVTPQSGYSLFQGLLAYLTNYLSIVASWIGGIGFTTTGILSQPDVFDTFWTRPTTFPGVPVQQ